MTKPAKPASENIITKFREFLLKDSHFWITIATVYLLTRITTLFVPIDGDHWIFWTVGKDIVDGGSLYITSWDHKPPLVFFFNSILFILGGDNIWIHRFIITLVSIGGVYLFYKLAKILTNTENLNYVDNRVKYAILFYVFWINLSQLSSGGNNTENLGIIALMSAYISYFKFFRSKKIWLLLLSGFFVSCLFFLKVNFTLFALPILIHIAFTEWKKWINIVWCIFLFGLPTLLHIGFWSVYFWMHNSFNDFLIASFFFNSKYISSGWIGKVSGQLGFISINLPLIIVFLTFLYFAVKEFKTRKTDQLYIFLLSLGGTSLIFISLLGTFYPYYYLIIIPAVSLLTGIYLSQLNFSRLLNKMILVGVIVCSAIAGVIALKQPYNFFKGESKADFLEQKQVAEYVKENTNQEDKIVAYVYGSTFYYLANRDQGARYTSASNLLLNYRENYGFGLNEKFINDAENTKPKYIIMLKDQNNLYAANRPIIEYFSEHYILEKSFDNYVVMRRVR